MSLPNAELKHHALMYSNGASLLLIWTPSQTILVSNMNPLVAAMMVVARTSQRIISLIAGVESSFGAPLDQWYLEVSSSDNWLSEQ